MSAITVFIFVMCHRSFQFQLIIYLTSSLNRHAFIMVQISDSLLWELTKKNTSFMKKVNGRTKRSGCVKFSTEKGNLKCLSKAAYSGLANSKTVDIIATEENQAHLVKKSSKKHHQFPKLGHVVTHIKKDFRRAEHVIKTQVVDNFYRPDLKDAAMAKYTKVYEGNRRAKGIKKVVPVKKGRGSSKE